MEANKRISDLFEAARVETPKTSFNEVKKHLLAASAVGSAGISAKFLAASFKLKLVIMTVIASTLTIGVILIATQFTGTETRESNKTLNHEQNQGVNIEVKRENGVERTTVYDENDRIVKVLVDSSGAVADKSDNRGEVTTIAPNQPKTIKNGTTPSEIVRETPKKRMAVANVQDSSMKVFEITQRTTTQELELIQKQATDAGIEFNYTARVKKDIVKRISMNMKINDGNSTWNSEISGTNSFRFTFGWWEDESGKVLRFLTDKEADIGAHRTNP